MTLLLETLGVLALAVVIMAALGLARSPRPTWPGVAAVIVAVAGSVFFAEVYAVGHMTVNIHDHFGRMTPVQRTTAGGHIFSNNNEPFLAWVDDRVPRGDRVYLDCGPQSACWGGLDEWITYRLLPRRFTDRPEDADWVLFFNTDASAADYAEGWERTRFAPNYELAEVS